MSSRTQELAEEFEKEIVALRRELHQNPEVGNDLPETQKRVLKALDGLDLEITKGKDVSSVTAVLRGGAAQGTDKPVVLLRGDMDGLPVTELVESDYKSTNGAMHACGHDLHTAGLVGAAKVLHALKDELAGDVVFMFQPGEEGPGGAKPMIDEGVLDAAGKRVDAAYGLHVMSSKLPAGLFTGRGNTLMASSDILKVKFVGMGGHGSTPYAANDPIPALAEAITALQTLVTRHFDVFDPVVLTVGKINGGTANNVIADSAEFAGTVRTFSKEAQQKIAKLSVELLEGIAKAHGLTPQVEYTPLYPVTVNDEKEFAAVRNVIEDVFGEKRFFPMPQPATGSEDFSYVLDEVPGAYFFLGAAVGDPETAESNHSPRAAFDDSVLADGAAALAEVTLRRLNGQSA